MKPETESDRPVIFVLFGAAGDLSHRLILPALYALHRDSQLPARFALIGADRVSLSSQELAAGYRESLTTGLRGLPDNVWSDFTAGIAYLQGDFVDHTQSSAPTRMNTNV
jgi:glucose-6-phosphate 1-dehydrogenase